MNRLFAFYVMLHTRNAEPGRKYGMKGYRLGGFRMPVDLKDVDEITIKWIPIKKYSK